VCNVITALALGSTFKGVAVLKVMLTVDTELWPRALQWPDRPMLHSRDRLQEDYERCILGRTSSGDYGLPFLLETLCQHDLKGVFFVESLYASAVGHAFLERTVRLIHSAGQEPQLHVHTEWLSEVAARDLPRTYRQNLRDFNVDEQSAVIRHALANLRAAGASEVSALRAGNMGGNHDTLLAAKNAGLAIDMSLPRFRSRSSDTPSSKRSAKAGPNSSFCFTASS
jgi:hypothetical protein